MQTIRTSRCDLHAVYIRPRWAAFNATINTTPNIVGRVTAQPSVNPLTALNTGLRYAVCRVPWPFPTRLQSCGGGTGRVDADMPSIGDAHVIFPPPKSAAHEDRIRFDLDDTVVGCYCRRKCIEWNDIDRNDAIASQFDVGIIAYISYISRRTF